MHSLRSIRSVENVDLRLIYAGATLEYILRQIEREYIARQSREVSLGTLVQRRKAFLGIDLLKDVSFAIGIRNSVAHKTEIDATSKERERAVEYLLIAAEQHLDLLPPDEQIKLRGDHAVQSKRKKTGSPLVPSTNSDSPGMKDQAQVSGAANRRKPPRRASRSVLVLILVLVALGTETARFLRNAPLANAKAVGPLEHEVAGRGASRTEIGRLKYKLVSELSPRHRIERVCITADGKTVVTGSQDKMLDGSSTLEIWDARTGEFQKQLGTLRGAIYDLAITPDGSTVASYSSEGAKIWDVHSGEYRHTFAEAGVVLTCCPLIGLTPDGVTLVSGVSVGEPRDNRLHSNNKPGDVSNAVLINVYDVLTGQRTRTFAGHHAGLTGLAVSRNGLQVATCSHDKTVKIWSTATGECQSSMLLHDAEQPLCVAFTPDDFELFVGLSRPLVGTKSVRLLRSFDAHTGEFLFDSKGDVAGTFLGFASRGRLIVTGPNNGNINIFDRQSKKIISAPLIDEDHRLRSMDVSEDAKTLVIADSDNRLRIIASD